jgi:hypothetical protein
MAHEGSIFNSERRAIEAAEARGYEAGLADRARLDIEFLDRMGHGAAANDLRQARLIDRDAGNVVDLKVAEERR